MDEKHPSIEPSIGTVDRLVFTNMPQVSMIVCALKVGREVPMTQLTTVEHAILQDLEQRGPCTIDELAQRLPDSSWNQVFTGVDQLSRSGQLTLRHLTTFEYMVFLNSQEQSDLHAVGIHG